MKNLLWIILFGGFFTSVFVFGWEKRMKDARNSCDCDNMELVDNTWSETLVSWYGYPFDGRITANGEIYDKGAITAASVFLKFGTQVLLQNLESGKYVAVRINDRGPFAVDSKGNAIFPLLPHPTRGFDLSENAFAQIADVNEGVVRVKWKILE